jgi:hypothetical protein
MCCKYLKIISFLSLTSLFIGACKGESEERPRPDVREITIDTTVIRWEQELFHIPKAEVLVGLEDMSKAYPEMYPFYINLVLNIPDSANGIAKYAPFMEAFLHDASMRELYDDVQKEYGDFSPYLRELHQAFRHYGYYFPKLPKPNLMTFISQFGPKTFYWGNTLGIGLDLYLGKDYKYYPTFDFPNYMLPRLSKEYLVSDAIYTLASDMVTDPYSKRGYKLIDVMVYYGKVYYIASHLTPDMHVRQFLYYSEDDWKWCTDNEKEIWSFFIEGEWLYSSQYGQFRKFVDDGPTTYGMPQGAPDRVARWTGYRIVKQFMAENPDVTLDQLAAMEDGQAMLSKSGYKPGK